MAGECAIRQLEVRGVVLHGWTSHFRRPPLRDTAPRNGGEVSDPIDRFKMAFADDPEFQKMVEIIESQPPVVPIEIEWPTETPFERLLKLIDEG